MKKLVFLLIIVLGFTFGTSTISSAQYFGGQGHFVGDSFMHSFGMGRTTRNFGMVTSNYNFTKINSIPDLSVAGNELEAEHHLFEVEHHPLEAESHPIGIKHHPFFEGLFSFSPLAFGPFLFRPAVYTSFVFSPVLSDTLFFNPF